jgi:DNA-binding CsgD family transcriptional regulator
MMRWSNELVESVTIRSVADIRPASVALYNAAISHGFRIAATPDIASADQLTDADGALVNADIFGWCKDGERWWEEKRLALISPLPRACRYESEPFWCNEDGAHTLFPNKYLDALSFADFKKFVAASSVIVVPVHLSFGQIAAASFNPLDYSLRDLSDIFAEEGDFLAMLARRYLASYAMIAKTQQWIPNDCRLSKREVECLRFAAIGKTDKEISMILELSHATVRYHVQRAGEKLNAVNRSQAVFKAGQLGYLGAAA